MDDWTRISSMDDRARFHDTKAAAEKWARGGKDPKWDGVYNETQEKLKADGVTEVKGYRGVKLPNDHPLVRALATGKVKPGQEIDTDGMTFASYSEDENVAGRFASGTKADESGVVLERVIDRSDVVMHHGVQDGFFTNEAEVVAKNTGKIKVRVVAARVNGKLLRAAVAGEESEALVFDLTATDDQRGILGAGDDGRAA